MTDITIPPEALRAARAASMNARGDGDDPIRAACLAMLKNWPGMHTGPAPTAEIARLRAENERLKEQLESPFMDGYETAKEEYRPLLIAAEAEVERLTAERDRQYDQNAEQITRIAALEAENERLRAALKPFANLTIKGDEPDVWAKKFPRFFELITTARAALEGK